MIPNVLPFQPDVAPAVLPQPGRGAANLSASGDGGFAQILQVKFPAQGDAPAATAPATDAPATTATPASASDAAETSVTAIPLASDATATAAQGLPTAQEPAVPSVEAAPAPQTTAQLAVPGKGILFRFPAHHLVPLDRQEAPREVATPDNPNASDPKPVAGSDKVLTAEKSVRQEQEAEPREMASEQAPSEGALAGAMPPLAAPTPHPAAYAAAPSPEAPQAVQPDAEAAVAEPAGATRATPTPLQLQEEPHPASLPAGTSSGREADRKPETRPTLPTVSERPAAKAGAEAPAVQSEVPGQARPEVSDFHGSHVENPRQDQGVAQQNAAATVSKGAGAEVAQARLDRRQEPAASVGASTTTTPASPAASVAAAVTPQVSQPEPGDKAAAGGAVPPKPEPATAVNENPGINSAETGKPQLAAIPTAAAPATATDSAAEAPATASVEAKPASESVVARPAIRQEISAPERRAARMVRELYGSHYQAKSPAQQEVPAQTAAELREAGTATETRSAPEVSKASSSEGIDPKAIPETLVTAENVKPQPVAAQSAAPVEGSEDPATPEAIAATETVGEKRGATPGQSQLREAKGHHAAAVAAERGELKEVIQPEEKPEVKVAAAGGAKIASAREDGKSGSFGDSAQKEQHDQKTQEKEQARAQQPPGIGTQHLAPAAAPAPEQKSAPSRTALHESILAQIKDGAVVHDQKGNGQISIRLNPGELGELKIDVRMENNRVHVEVQADNKMVKDLLLSNVQSLKETLAAKNFTMEGFDVSTGSREGFNNQLSDDRGNSWQRPTPRTASFGSYSEGTEPARVKYLTGDVNNLLDVRF